MTGELDIYGVFVPSLAAWMLLAFLITSEDDYVAWREGVQSVQGKCVVHVQDHEPAPRGQEREGAVDEVESWDEDGLQ